MLDAAIIGGGPAALSAAIYLGRAGYQTKVFERGTYGGAVVQIAKLANYPGYLGAGKDLAEKMHEQATIAGAQLEYGECTALEQIEGGWQLTVDDEVVRTKIVLIATGSEPRQLDFELDVPVSYCALCDGPLTRGKNIAVVGGANSALHESIYLAQLAEKLTLISHSELKAEQTLVDKLQQYDNVKIVTNVEPTPELLNQYEYVFVSIGKRPATNFLPKEVLNEYDYVIAEAYQTILPGLFAAGDVRDGAVRQVITAAGEGAAAAKAIIDTLKA